MNSRSLHRWLGLTVGLVFSLVCLSGSLLLHKSSLFPLIYPDLEVGIVSKQTQVKLDISTVKRLISTQTEKPLAVVLPKQDWPFYTLAYNKTRKSYYSLQGDFLLSIDSKSNVFAWLLDLHQNLLLGDRGKNMNAWVQFVSLCLLITGLAIWWPRNNLFRNLSIKKTTSKRLLYYQIHRSAGVLAMPVFLLMITSGIALIYYPQTQQLLSRWFDKEQETHSINYEIPSDLEAIFKDVSGIWSDIQWTAIYLPGNNQIGWRLRGRFEQEWHPNGRSFITVVSGKGQKLVIDDARRSGAGRSLAQRLYPIHSAAIGGEGYKWLLTLVGVTPIILWLSGIYLYGFRLRNKSKRVPGENHLINQMT
ncbi:PepSY domain-containing protein [Aliikangiella sp. G2MR2-5]|uniref:PepSY-associated TM helix domain-containing protein n=1 Tax=Aliikangiella sp. G2MR2-5 TaxID=2788943 RepID=UPI0018A89BE6|nr:PepSY-associated TM helix domain-containing protein [Aliikangiella sp. G2MR2-5]